MKWISVKKRLPKENQFVLIICRGDIEVSKFLHGKFLNKECIGEWQDVEKWATISVKEILSPPEFNRYFEENFWELLA